MANEQTPPVQEQASGQLNILKVYLKDLSVENPGAPDVFQQNKMPTVEMNLRTNAKRIADDMYESVLTVTLSFKLEEKTVLLAEASQAGIFNISGIPDNILQPILAIHCPTILLPYAREVISSAVGQAGFPPFYVPPTNFEALYRQQLSAQAKSQEAGDAEPKEDGTQHPLN